MPWALEILGFDEPGPLKDRLAAAWQRTDADYVPKGSLFSYFQRLGMKWHWVVCDTGYGLIDEHAMMGR